MWCRRLPGGDGNGQRAVYSQASEGPRVEELPVRGGSRLREEQRHLPDDALHKGDEAGRSVRGVRTGHAERHTEGPMLGRGPAGRRGEVLIIHEAASQRAWRSCSPAWPS